MRLAFDSSGAELMARDSDIETGIAGTVWVDAPVDWEVTKRYALESGVPRELEIYEYDPKRLRVFRALSPLSDPLVSDFTIIGFRKVSPSYDRGRKIAAQYICAVADDLIVTKTFSDTFDDNGLLNGIQVQFDWYCEDDTIGLTKTEVVKSLNKYEAATVSRQRRERAIDYLVAGAAGTPVEPFLTFLFDRYYTEVQKFKDKDNTALLAAIAGESDPTALAYLDLDIPQGDGSYTLKVAEIITYQVS